jgi:hypothetical protein
VAERAANDPWSRLDRALLALLIAVVALGLAFLVHPWFDRANDASVYILTAKALARGEGYTYLGIPFVVRPPALSALLVPFVGEATPNFHALNLLTSAFGAIAALLFYAYCRPILGGVCAFLAALVLWALPGFQLLGNQTMSDMPGLTLLLACLVVERLSMRAPHLRWDLMLGVLIAAGTYMRTVLFVLVPAIALARLVSHFGSADRASTGGFALRRLALFSLTALALVIPWGLRNGQVEVPPPADQTRQISNSALFWHRDAGDPTSERFTFGDVLARIPERSGEAFRALGRLEMANAKEGADERGISALQAALAAVLLAGLLYAAVRRRRAAELYLLGSLALLSVFPTTFLDRYILPVFALCLCATVELVRDALRRAAGPGVSQVAPAAGLAVLALVAFSPRAGWDEIERRHDRFQTLCDDVAAKLAPDAQLAAEKGWHLSVYLNRPVHSLRLAVRRDGLRAGAESVIDRYDLNTVLVLENQRDYGAYFAKRYAGRLRRAAESTMIVRVRD